MIILFWWLCCSQLQYPVYWDLMEFCDGFRKLLDHLQLDKVSLFFLIASNAIYLFFDYINLMIIFSHFLQVHLFGASLGGFLAQKFAEYTHKSPRVHSLILCNSFSDTSIFNQTWTANR